MCSRRLSFILPLLARSSLLASLLASLAACDQSDAPNLPPPASSESLAAITEDPGISRERLGQAIDTLFDSEQVGETQALIVKRGGSIIAERYGDGFGKETRLPGWSMSKCLTGVMIGLLVSDGRLRLNETAPVPAWQRSGDARGEITLKQLLQMRSGLRHEDVAEPAYASDTTRMLFLSGRGDMASFAEAQPLEAEPGREFEDSAASTIILADLVARSLTDSENPQVRQKTVSTFLRTRLLDPAGLTSMTPEFDAAGTMIGSSMIHATARDWGKLGDFIRHYGSVRGAQVIPRRWIEFMRDPSPRNPGYGAHLWLNHPQSDGTVRLYPGRASENLFACIGEGGQYVIGSPTEKLTIVRLGNSETDQADLVRERLGDIIALFAAS